MRHLFNICHFYLIICLLCAFNGLLYAPGGIISQGLQAILIIMSMYYAVYANTHYRLPVLFKSLNVLLVMFTIYGFQLIISGEQFRGLYLGFSKTEYLKSIYVSLLPIYAFYVFAQKNMLTEKIMKTWFFVFLLLTINSYFRTQNRMMQEFGEMGLTRDEFVNNVGYSFVGLLPAVVLFQKKPFIQYLLLTICMFFVIMSMKRGAILIGVLCSLWFMAKNIKNTKNNKKWIIVILSLVIVLSGVYYYNYRLSTSSFFQKRVDQTIEGNSSGRDVIYSNYLNHFLQEDNPLRFLFGYGANGTLIIGSEYAHNDWLEIAINQGFLGIIVFLIYWVCFINTWRKKRKVPQSFMIIGLFFIVYFMSTLFSMSYNSVTRCSAMVLGYSLSAPDSET